MEYGVCRGTDPKCYHDWARAKLFTDPSFAGAAEFNKMITGGLKSVMGIEPFCQ